MVDDRRPDCGQQDQQEDSICEGRKIFQVQRDQPCPLGKAGVLQRCLRSEDSGELLNNLGRAGGARWMGLISQAYLPLARPISLCAKLNHYHNLPNPFSSGCNLCHWTSRLNVATTKLRWALKEKGQ